MRCSSCGHENNNLATHCSACGAALDPAPDLGASNPDTQPLSAENTREHNPLTGLSAGDTQGRLPPTEAPKPTVEGGPRGGRGLRAGLSAFAERIRSRQRVIGLVAVALVMLVLAGTWLVMTVADAPTYEQIEADVSKLAPTYSYQGGTYGPDLEIPLSSVTVSKRSATKTPEGMEASAGIGPKAYEVSAEATYDDGHIRVVRAIGATYVNSDTGWQLGGEFSEQGTSLSARAGVDEDKVVANVGSLLEAATTAQGDGGLGALFGDGATLADIYAGASFTVVGNDFEASPDKDTSTDVVVIRCAKDYGFYSYEGNLTAHFAFESGSWKLRSAEADDAAFKRSYHGLVGTWGGSCVDHSSNAGACLAAQDSQLSITIESVGDSNGDTRQVQGTISGLVHAHGRLDADASSDEGDITLDRQSFWGELSTDYTRSTDSSLNLEATVSAGPNCELHVLVGFGTGDDPSSVVAKLTSSYSYEETVLFFIPRRTEATFTDTYLLSRTG